MLILLTAMAVLLPLLATLQYYWLGQVSEGANERLQVSLRASAAGFRRDFNREFIRAYLNFQSDSFAPPVDLEKYHAEHWDEWQRTAPYPRLISDVFVVNYDDQDQPHLSRLDANAKRLEAIEWSGELEGWRDRFTRTGATTGQPHSIESFAEDIPALIVPFPLPRTEEMQQQNLSLPPGFTIVKLDLNYMQHDFIPALVQRYLLDSTRSEYHVAVVDFENPDRVIYSSRVPVPNFASSDVSVRIFGLQADELRSFLGAEGTPSTLEKVSGTRPLKLVNLRLFKRQTVNPVDAANDENGSWQLLIKHQSGSLATAVANARHRNLAISFGILLLLGAGILMTAISTRRAERLARQQINFVAGVTHELRTPLAVICSAGENLADGIVDNPQKAAQYGQVIYREGRRLTDMVEQVLEFAGAQSGQRRYEFRSTDVNAFIRSAVAACQTHIPNQEFVIETLIEPNLAPVWGNAAALRRALQNLISNAIKYDGQNHWARVSARGGAPGNEIEITVEDRGLGVNPVDLPHVFEPFYRGREAIAAQIEGSGVGLSLVKQIVEAHGGRVSVKSTPGLGSTFTLHLPVGKTMEAEPNRRTEFNL